MSLKTLTRPEVDKVKPKGWFKYSLLLIDVLSNIHIGEMHLVLLALNLSIMDACK